MFLPLFHGILENNLKVTFFFSHVVFVSKYLTATTCRTGGTTAPSRMLGTVYNRRPDHRRSHRKIFKTKFNKFKTLG